MADRLPERTPEAHLWPELRQQPAASTPSAQVVRAAAAFIEADCGCLNLTRAFARAHEQHCRVRRR